MSKKVLIITYYWPPSGGPGVQRVLKFVKYLPALGWEPHILTVQNGEYPAIDESLVKDIHPLAKVHKVPSVEFFDLFRRLTGKKKGDKIETYELIKEKNSLSLTERFAQFIRLNLLIPDARIGWYLFSFRKSLDIARKIKPDIIFSSSPPHSLQLLAGKLSRKMGVQWVADFRDPWTQSFYDKGTVRGKLATSYNLSLEKKTISQADAVTSVSQGVLDLLGAPGHTAVIPNGYDEDDFEHDYVRSDKFRIVYTGHLASVQNPEKLFEALAALDNTDRQCIILDFYGSVDATIIGTIEKFDLEDVVNFHGYVNHSVVTRTMVESDLLLLVIPRTHAKGILTGKLFEYLAAGNFILGIGDEQGIASEVIRTCEAGYMIDYDKSPLQILTEQINLWKKGKRSTANKREIEKYSRRKLTERLAQLFEELCS